MMDIDILLKDLFSRRTRGIKPGLERMVEAAKELQNPQDAYKIVHIAGTNGKGSTASIISVGLREAGNRVGLFTSPHIIEFRERFIINGTPVSNDCWVAVWNDIQPLCDSLELTFFEISALIAFELFKREGCNYVVLETGLGGRLDATNICDPILSVITALSVEHTEYLGDTIEEIATEKLGIVKPNRPLVINGNNLLKILELAGKRCIEQGSSCSISTTTDLPLLETKPQSQIFQYRDKPMELHMMGRFQQQNCSVAVKALELIGISEDVIRQGVSKAFIPCRLQYVKVNGKQYLFDVAHNPQAVNILCDSLPKDQPIHFLIGMMKDKEVDEMVIPIVKIAKSVVVVEPSIPRALSSFELGETTYALSDGIRVHSDSDFGEAIKYFDEKEGLHVVTGSFYTVSEALLQLGISPYDH